MTTLIISNDEIHDIIKIEKYLKDSGLLLKEITETVQNEVKEQILGYIRCKFKFWEQNLCYWVH